jgi:SAM-dependent methyltransferase
LRPPCWRAREKNPWENITFIEADATSLPLPDATFDEVICNATFPHLTDKAVAVAEMARVLKPGGRIVGCHPASREFINRLHRSLGGVVANDLIPDDATMRAVFAHAGFESIEIENRDDRHVLTARKSSVLYGRRGLADILHWLGVIQSIAWSCQGGWPCSII